MEIKETYCTVETMFSKIYERLATNEWKVDVYHGNTIPLLDNWRKLSGFKNYNFDDDEFLIEQIPKVNLPSDFEWTPIIVMCMKRELEIDYGVIPIDTPVSKRKDFAQYVFGKQGQTEKDLKFDENFPIPSAARHKIMVEWFITKLQIYVDRKNGINSKIGHPQFSDFSSLSQHDASNLLCMSIRLHSVWMFELAQQKLEMKSYDKSGKESAVQYVLEDDMFDNNQLNSSLKLLNIAISFDNENFPAWWWKGYVLYKMEKYEEAEQSFKTSYNINPMWSPSIFYEGKMLTLRGYPHLGLEKINKALKLFVELPWLVYKARVCSAMGMYVDAIVEYDKALVFFEKSKNYRISYLEFILYSKFIALEKLGYHDESFKVLNTLLELKQDQKLKEKFEKSVKTKKISAEQISELEKEVEVIQDFVLTKNAEENIKKLVDILKNLKNFIYWSDQYFSKNGFEWIREACLENNSLDEVKILSGIERKDELLNRPFKRKMDQLKKFLNEKNIKFQVKVVSDDKIRKRFHGRFIISEDVVLMVPSVNNFNSGSMDGIAKIDITIEETEFLEWWEKSMDYVKFRDENKDV